MIGLVKFYSLIRILDWTGKILQFDKDPGLDKCPGNVYLAPYDGISIRCNLEYDGEYEDQEFRLECQARDKVARNESYLMKREAKMKREGDDLIRDCLRPLSKVYHSTNAAGRSVLLAQIIQYVQRKL